MNYGELKTQIADWLMRSDLEAVIPIFVTNGHSLLEATIRHRLMLEGATLTFGADGSAPVPEDFLEAKALTLDTGDGMLPLEEVEMDSAEWLFKHRPTRYSYFAVSGGEIRTRPTYSGPGELLYYQQLPKLEADIDTNWLLERAPSAYLYAALRDAAVYLRHEGLLAESDAKLAQVQQALTGERQHAQTSRIAPQPPELSQQSAERARPK